MNRKHRIHKKQEKRIVKLLYRKGFILPKRLKEIYWDNQWSFMPAKTMTGYFDSYCGEWSDNPLVDEFLYDFQYSETQKDEYGFPKMIYIHPSRKTFIKYLQTLPTLRNDSKINAVLVAKIDY